ncbi:MAG: tetratricopeptide repeat protein [Phycisphaerales bacterium]
MKKYGIHIIYIALAIITFIAYEPVLHNSFITFDDDTYIYSNPNIKTGLSLENVIWAFTSIHANNYHPLTSISHMLDCEIYNLNAAGHHLTNLIFHIFNTSLLFYVLTKMTKRMWASAFVAALFALHPLHVESVAWASERKDVLCTFFWLLTMLVYWYYAQRQSLRRYILTLGVFTLGALSKPMIVTLPCVLLLMDYWPLDRFKKVKIPRMVLEKIPFLLISATISVITLSVQGKMGLVKDIARYPFGWRLENAIMSYFTYLEKMFWPFNLAVFYPHPKGTILLWQTLAALAILVAITIFVVWKIRQRPYMAVGWFWFVGTLVPVIGLCQVGMQAWANRYTYIPYTGLFIAITWLLADAIAKLNIKKTVCAGFAGVLLFGLGLKTYVEAMYWQNNLTLYSHAAKVVKDNWWAYGFLGVALGVQGEYDEADKMLSKSIEIYPDNATIYYELAKISMYRSDWKQAIAMYEKLLPPLPEDLNAPRNDMSTRFDYPMLRNLYLNGNINLAIALTNEGRYAEAQRRYMEALRVIPDLEAAKEGLKNLQEKIKQASEIRDANTAGLK